MIEQMHIPMLIFNHAPLQISMSVLKEPMNVMSIATTPLAVILVTVHQLGLATDFTAMAPPVKVSHLSLVHPQHYSQVFIPPFQCCTHTLILKSSE